jgi:hypothetical protein
MTLQIEQQNIEIDREDIDSWCPMFALPCYDRALTEPFFMSFMKTVMYCKDIGLKFAVSTITDSLINRARNNLVAKFMANPQFTHLIFLDVDLSFNAQDIVKLLWHDKDIITGAYPIKEINWDKVIKNVNNGIEAKDLAKKSTRFVVNPVRAGGNTIQTDNGAISVYDAGTGFMCIKRSVFEKMIEAYPDLKFNDDTGSMNDEERNWTYAFFNSYVDDDGRFVSEDYGFCRYWQKLDGKVWADPGIEIGHLGRLMYEGSMIDYLVEISDEATKDNARALAQPNSKNQSKKSKK